MQLATIRVHDTEILSLACPRLDAQSGVQLLALIAASVKRGARSVVLDLGPVTVVDFAGARALEAACAQLGAERQLCVAGLSGRTRSFLRSARVAPQLPMVEWWTEAVELGVPAA